jgi:hypothetical protein
MRPAAAGQEKEDPMLVGVTGGTAFVEAPSVAALLAAGHGVPLLARDPAHVGLVLLPLGGDSADVGTVACDATDEAVVPRALGGTDAGPHLAAAVYGFNSRRCAEVVRSNEAGTRTVPTAAVLAGVDPIVHVSSVAALCPTPAGRWREGAPVGADRAGYGGVYTCAYSGPTDERAGTFGIEARPLADRLPDTVARPHAIGRLTGPRVGSASRGATISAGAE